MAISENQKKYLTNMANGKDEYGNKTSAGNVAWAKAELKKAGITNTSSSTSTSSNNSTSTNNSALSRYHNQTVHNTNTTGTITPSGVVNNGTVTNKNITTKTNPAKKSSGSSSTNKSTNTSSGDWRSLLADDGSSVTPEVQIPEVQIPEVVENYPVDPVAENPVITEAGQDVIGDTGVAWKSYLEQLQQRYDDQNALIREQNEKAVAQGKNRLIAQKENVNDAFIDNASKAYVKYMQNKKVMPQQLASQGYTGGITETSALGINSDYENNLNDFILAKTNALQDIDNAIIDLENTGDLSAVEQVLSNNQRALDAYASGFLQSQSANQWATEFSANRSDVASDIAYRDKVYTDEQTKYEDERTRAIAQQELENSWRERNYSDAVKQDETNRIIEQLQLGLVNADYASTLLKVPAEQLTSFVDYIKKLRSAELSNTYSLINNRNTETEEKKAKVTDIFDTAFQMTKTEGYTDDDIIKYIWGQGLTEEEEMNILNNLGLLSLSSTVNERTHGGAGRAF